MSNKYYYIFDESIENESVQKLIDTLYDKENIVLYFSTNGGCVPFMYILIDFLNSLGDRIEVVLINSVCSVGTEILTDYRGKLTVSDELELILFHMEDRQMYSFRKQQVSINEMKRMTKDANNKQKEKLIKLGLTEKEIKKFDRGEDVILYKKDFNRLKLQQI